MFLKVSLVGIKLKHISFSREIELRLYPPCHLAKEVTFSHSDPGTVSKARPK